MSDEPIMRPEDLAAILDFLELDDAAAALCFGLAPADVAAMRAGDQPVPFLVSALTVLMCESDKATRLALEHGRAMRDHAPSLAELIAEATAVGFTIKAEKPRLRLVD